MAKRMKAIVIGGSLGGLFAANLLYRAGWDVEVFERVGEALADRGAGIVTHDELFKALRRVGIRIDDTFGVDAHSRVTLDRDGRVVAETRIEQVLTAWGRMYRLLKDHFPEAQYHFGRSLVRVEQDALGVTANFADGARVGGDLLVGADGIRSSVRAQFLPSAKPLYAGYVAWRGLADEAAVSADVHRHVAGRMAFCLPPGEQILAYLVAGRGNTTKVGTRRYNFVWYRPAHAATQLPPMLTDAAGNRYEMNLPPDRIRAEVLTEMRDAADGLLAPQFAEIIRATTDPFFQPIYDLESPRLAFGRVAILGDAAFVARPHVGLGVTKAAGDGIALVECLSRHGADLHSALREYEARRTKFGIAIVAHARDLGTGIGEIAVGDPTSGLATHMRKPEVVMREIAVPDWAGRTATWSHLRRA